MALFVDNLQPYTQNGYTELTIQIIKIQQVKHQQITLYTHLHKCDICGTEFRISKIEVRIYIVVFHAGELPVK